MQSVDHPTFAADFIKYFLLAFAVLVGCFVSGFYFLSEGDHYTGMIFMGAFATLFLATFVFFFWRMFFVSCPNCSGKTRTRGAQGQEWVADCEACQIRWRLGVSGGRRRHYH